MSNRVVNSVSAFAYDSCGALRFLEEDPTAGAGTGEAVADPLASQGSIATGRSGRFLFAVNAGSNTVTSFLVENGELTLSSVLPSGGARPVGIAVFRSLVYVLNAGDAGTAANLSGFSADRDGVLSPIAGSMVPLSGANPQPACAVFSRDGRHLVVSERGTNRLLSFLVQSSGRLTGPTVAASNGTVPFGMAFSRCGVLLVAEAGPNALSSYSISSAGALTLISGSVATNQGGTCWVSVTPDGRFAYATNAGTGTVSAYKIGSAGELTLVESVPTTPLLDGAPIDNAVDPRGRFLYALNGAQGSISAFQIGCEGHPQLIQIYSNTALPQVGAQGLAVC